MYSDPAYLSYFDHVPTSVYLQAPPSSNYSLSETQLKSYFPKGGPSCHLLRDKDNLIQLTLGFAPAISTTVWGSSLPQNGDFLVEKGRSDSP